MLVTHLGDAGSACMMPNTDSNFACAAPPQSIDRVILAERTLNILTNALGYLAQLYYVWLPLEDVEYRGCTEERLDEELQKEV